LEDTAAQFRWRSSDALDRTDEILHQFMEVVGAAVGQFPLGQRPDSLIGVELGGVGREMLDVETRMLALELVQGLPLVGARVVQERNHRPPQMAQELAHLLLPDILEPELVVEAQVVPFRAEGDSRDDRDFVPSITMTVNRSAATGCPDLDDIGDQQESGLVREDEMGAQPRTVFFTRGQSLRFQRWMACSSRSTARVSGFW